MSKKRTVGFINPNSTKEMTHSCFLAFRANLAPELDAVGITNDSGPASIQGPLDGDAAIPGVIEIIQADAFDSYIIGCFDDTGLTEARKISTKPIIGIGQASFHLAALKTSRFRVLTTLAVSIPVIKNNILSQGFGTICDGVYASGVPVLDLETNVSDARRRIASKISEIASTEKKSAIILGCAGMTNVWASLQNEFDTPLVDPVAAAAKIISFLLE